MVKEYSQNTFLQKMMLPVIFIVVVYNKNNL